MDLGISSKVNPSEGKETIREANYTEGVASAASAASPSSEAPAFIASSSSSGYDKHYDTLAWPTPNIHDNGLYKDDSFSGCLDVEDDSSSGYEDAEVDDSSSGCWRHFDAEN